MTFPVSIFVRSSYQAIKTSKDLAKSKLAVVKMNAAMPLLKQRGDVELVVFSSLGIAFNALITGQVDAFAYPEPVTWQMAREIDLDDKIRLIEPPILEVKHAIAVAKNKMDLKDGLDTALSAFLLSEDYKQIYQQWLIQPEKSFWDARKVFWAMAALLLIVIIHKHSSNITWI